MEKGRVCTKCGEWKPFSEFNNSKKSKYGKTEKCKKCHNQASKILRENKKKNETKICRVKDCDNKVYVRDLCNAHYLRNRRYGDPNIKKKEQTIKLEIEVSISGCFEVISHKLGAHGYPQVNHKKEPRPAHRKVYEEMFGEIPKGLVVRHKCDNKLCVNPEHLLLGTNADNMRDAYERDRVAYGERNGSSKLTEEDVKKIKKIILIKKKVTKKEIKNIANEFNVSPSTIYDIYYNKTWVRVKVGEVS